VFLGLGMGLTLLSKFKEQLKTKLFPNLNVIRDLVMTSIDNWKRNLLIFSAKSFFPIATLIFYIWAFI
jgi:hypothetical protein